MNKNLFKDALGWGFLLWFFGYILGIIFFMVAPKNLIGFLIMPLGVLVTLWVLFKRIKIHKMNYYLYLSVSWTLIAFVLDYLFIVKALKSADYYKFDVLLYYFLTFALPLFAGFKKNRSLKNPQ